MNLKKAVLGIQEHAEKYWEFNPGDLEEIELTKIDVACDMKGAFMPGRDNEKKEFIRKKLDVAFNGIITDHWRNFLSLSRALNVRIINGDNNLNSCYQYVVKDSDNEKLLTIKIYDKILDLIGRDGRQMVGSRMATVLNSSQHNDYF